MKPKLFQKFNWKYTLGELVLIFMGITLAIWFNNWNDYRKERALEVRILKEITQELNDDIEDIKINKGGHELAIRSGSALLNYYLGRDTLAEDSLGLYVSMVYRNFTSISNTASYDYLKSVGIGTISNDSLRRKLSRLYDVTYENIRKIEERHQPSQFFAQHKDLIWAELEPLIRFDGRRFVLSQKRRDGTEQFSAQLVYTLSEIQGLRGYIVKYYEDMLTQIDVLKEEINDHIATLE